MGQDKAWIPFNGTPLIEHSLRLVREAGAGEVLISGRAGQDFSALGCPVLLDVTPDCGPLGGIERALDVATHPLVLVLAVDLPHLTSECLRWLEGYACEELQGRVAFHRVPTGTLPDVKPGAAHLAMGAVPILHGKPEPLAALYPTRAHPIVKRMLGEERLAAREFAEACMEQGLVRGVPVPTEHEQCFTNWNTPEDVGTGE